MQIDIYGSYEEANRELGLPWPANQYGDGLPELDQDIHPEQYSCVVYVRKWTDSGNEGNPYLGFIGLECKAHFCHDKHDLFIYARYDGNDSH